MSSATMPPSEAFAAVVFGDPRLHTESDILALAYDTDGALWSVEESGKVNQWDLQTGQPGLTFSLSDLETLWCFNHNARLLASASDDVSIWDAKSGNLLVTIPQDSWVTALAFHTRKAIIATGHDEGVVRLWDINKPAMLREMKLHKGAVSALAFSADGSQLASGAEDKLIALWQVDSGKHLGNLEGHKDRIPAIVWHPDGKTIVSAGWDTTARVWDVEKREPIILLNTHATQVWTLAFSNDGQLLACGDSTPSVHIWNYADKKELHVLREENMEFRHLAFSPNGKQLAAGGSGLIHLWDPIKGKSLSRSTGTTDIPLGMSLSPDGNRLATNGAWGLQVWDTQKQKSLFRLEESLPVHTLAYSPDGKWIAGGTDEYIRLWETANGQPAGILEGPNEPTTALAFSADSKTLASGSSSGVAVWIWRAHDGEPILLIPDALDGCTVEALAWHPGGRRLAVGGIDPLVEGHAAGAVSIWDIEDRCEIATFVGGVTCLTFDQTGKLLIVGDMDSSVCVWDVESKELVREMLDHDGAVRAVAISPDGNWLISGGDDWTLHVWDTTTWSEKAVHSLDTQIKILAFSPDGKYLYTGNGNTTCYRLEVNKLLT